MYLMQNNDDLILWTFDRPLHDRIMIHAPLIRILRTTAPLNWDDFDGSHTISTFLTSEIFEKRRETSGHVIC